MNVAFLINNYFSGKENLSIDVFDAQTLNNVYQDVMRTLTSHLEIETAQDINPDDVVDNRTDAFGRTQETHNLQRRYRVIKGNRL